MLVARADPLRTHLYNCKAIHGRNSTSTHNSSYTLVHCVRSNYLFNCCRDRFLFFTIFQCDPVAYYWNHYPETGHCLDINILLGIVYLYSRVAATCDIILGSFPILLVWGLQMDRRTKTAVSGILGIGGMFVCSAVSQLESDLKHVFSERVLL